MTTELVSIPFHGQSVQSVEIDGKPHVVFRPLVESLGLDADSQMKRLRRHSWATTVKMTGVGLDGKNREMTCIDLRTLTMWLATIDENRVSEEARPLVVAYQNEVADAIESYWAKGGAINPRATEHQQKAMMFELRSQMELAQAAKGLIHDAFLEAKARIILARGMGETPELDPTTRPLYVQQFLKEKGLSKKQLGSKASGFGKRLKNRWTAVNGIEPKKAPIELTNGRIIEVYGYTEADRPLMEQVWNQYYAA
ncbi:phage antirepressor N-terminal domain-containing protein [Corynebacterium diphtheriae]|uniref:Phage antirepressor n=2 Tax=Corynebacterium TaxID=1716 RepID=A0A811G2J7_CORDP|nr:MULTISPECIES: phage antirepressor N-terminal domain-containing protein [Corynebacterium]OWO45833.1 phage antirepressor [Corynebacterium belfantii]MDT9411342.1 phage antirepressor N-terminal domain-containing protein [Corynebacterium rouxii]OJI03912.1 phage antirepressor [Corynebacterium diphtheriae]OWM42202.1 phage antirepressor [Corynebacterium diphtheriae]OWM61652.1 phage antirepressor [Corynebacterium diphtheriae]